MNYAELFGEGEIYGISYCHFYDLQRALFDRLDEKKIYMLAAFINSFDSLLCPMNCFGRI